MNKELLRRDLEELLEMQGKNPGIAIFWLDGGHYQVRGEVSDADVLLCAGASLRKLVTHGHEELKEMADILEIIIQMTLMDEKALEELRGHHVKPN